MILHLNHLHPGQATRAGEVLAAVLGLVEGGRVDPRLLPGLRVHLDWIQYRSNFREVVTARRAVDQTGEEMALAEVAVDWAMPNPPNVDGTGVTATGATAGTPGYFTPSGAATPANLAALTGLTASPATNWAAGQYVITADLLANNWNGSAWVAGKHP